jgi:hypothetical protein
MPRARLEVDLKETAGASGEASAVLQDVRRLQVPMRSSVPCQTNSLAGKSRRHALHRTLSITPGCRA